jgi:hypothetical protein
MNFAQSFLITKARNELSKFKLYARAFSFKFQKAVTVLERIESSSCKVLSSICCIIVHNQIAFREDSHKYCCALCMHQHIRRQMTFKLLRLIKFINNVSFDVYRWPAHSRVCIQEH